ncbi:ABC transporter substrate-binding protein [Caldilinea sp.]|jgi:multiple sugar transport system substrate-binding protein/raffinose/stachyose/melibiose transport system substrate-binding protein|uniref:ABC transporter substrate-binding protein n=1 Tax=Caldilinea sp. TaxID=2293560 RepID=UPI0021DE8D0A|nr:ABC transporter substrate-binding protein [Caldilinea sp.]GIV70132.1 MAG: ABC transporter substrate-binding protein [Caldilinea sp.]
MTRKSSSLLLTLLLLFSMALSACATPVTAPPAAEAPAPAAPTVNKITYNSYQSDPAPRAWIEGVVANWNAAHPDMPVDLSIIAHEDFKQALRAMLTANPAPDVLDWFAGNRARFFIDRGLIADFSDLWEREGWDAVYAPGFIALATYNGGKYFLPSSYYWWAIYYRPSLFEQAGVQAPIETFDDLLAACDALNAAGITPITIGARFKWPAAAWFDYLNMRTNGPEFHIELMDLKVPYTDPRVRAVFENWKKLIDAKCFISDPAAYDWQEAIDPMVQGQAAMYLMGAFITDSYPDEAENDLDFFRFPVINPDVPIGEDAPTDGYFLAANAGNLAGGKEFLAYLGSKEVQQSLLDTLGRLPSRVDVDISNISPATQKGIQLIQSADFIAQFYDRDTTPPMAEAGMDGMMRFWDNPDQIDQILEELEAERQRILAEAEE